MKALNIDSAFGETPEAFTRRIDATLLALGEEKPMKKFALRTVAVTALVLALLCGIALAVTRQGLNWFYANRYGGERGGDAQLRAAIQADIIQQSTCSLVDVSIQDAVWLDDTLFEFTLAARVNDTAAYEMHPARNIDPDGAYSPADVGTDDIARAEHWLWTTKGFGPIQQTMTDPNKTLLLFEVKGVTVGTADGPEISRSSYDVLMGEDGATLAMLSMDLASADPERARAQMEESYRRSREYREQEGQPMTEAEKAEWRLRIDAQAEDAGRVQEAIQRATDENGFLSLVYHYETRLAPPQDDSLGRDYYAIPHSMGCVLFKVKIK